MGGLRSSPGFRHEMLMLGLAGALAAIAPAAALSTDLDFSGLPVVHGTVARYVLTADGDVSGLLLGNGTELLVSPRRSLEVVFVARPGEAVTAHGLPVRGAKTMVAMVVSNDATHASVQTVRVGGRHQDDDTVTAQGVVATQLHDENGALCGVVLADGTTVAIAPEVAAQIASQLAVGAHLYARGEGTDGPLGRALDADVLGASQADARAMPGSDDGRRDR